MVVERTMAFIVEQQEQFEADLIRINKTMDRHITAIGALVKVAQLQSEHQTAMNKATHDLLETSRQQSARSDRLEKRMAESYERLSGVQQKTEKCLDDFIAQVSRYLVSSNDRRQRPDVPHSG